jgi:hypothetical protein
METNYGSKAKQGKVAHQRNMPYFEEMGNAMAEALAALPQCDCDTNFCKDCIQNQNHRKLLKTWEELTGFLPQENRKKPNLYPRKNVMLKIAEVKVTPIQQIKGCVPPKEEMPKFPEVKITPIISCPLFREF